MVTFWDAIFLITFALTSLFFGHNVPKKTSLGREEEEKVGAENFPASTVTSKCPFKLGIKNLLKVFSTHLKSRLKGRQICELATWK